MALTPFSRNTHAALRLAAWSAVAAALSLGSASHAQTPQSRPVTLIVPYAPGGTADALARQLGERLAKRLGQPVVIDNKPGAGTLIGTQAAARATPDGHTLLLSASTITVQPSVNKNFNIDVERDLTPVTEAVRGMFLIAGGAQFPARSLKDLIDQARANPNAVAYGTPGAGSSPHLTGAYLGGRAGVNLLHVPYKGSAPALNAVLAGETQFIIDPVFTLKPQVEASKLHALAVTGATRSPLLPAVPTVAESGMPGFEVTYWIGFFAPAGTPAGIVNQLSREMAAVIRDPEMAKRLQEQGFDPVGNTPAEFAQRVKTELAQWKKLVQEQNIKVE